MATDSVDSTRRRVLQAAGVSLTTALAGCGAQDSPQTGTGSPTPGTPGTDTPPPESPTQTVTQLNAYPRVRIASVADLATGNVEEFAYPLQGQQNFLAKLGTEAWGGVGPDNDVVAFSAQCTHAGCSVAGAVSPRETRAGPCPCHFTSFDLAKGGLVVIGQATTDLPQVALEVEDGEVYATHVDGLVWGYHNNLRGGEPIEAAQG